MNAYYANKLTEAAKVIDAYDEQELELIKLAGFNLSTLIEKLKAGYTIEAPKENLAPHLVDVTSMLGDYWSQGFRVYHMAPGVEWDDLTEYEQRKFLESYVKFMGWVKKNKLKEV